MPQQACSNKLMIKKFYFLEFECMDFCFALETTLSGGGFHQTPKLCFNILGIDGNDQNKARCRFTDFKISCVSSSPVVQCLHCMLFLKDVDKFPLVILRQFLSFLYFGITIISTDDKACNTSGMSLSFTLQIVFTTALNSI